MILVHFINGESLTMNLSASETKFTLTNEKKYLQDSDGNFANKEQITYIEVLEIPKFKDERIIEPTEEIDVDDNW